MKFRKGIFLKCFFKKTYYFLISSPCKASTYAKKRSYIQLVGVGACFCWFFSFYFIWEHSLVFYCRIVTLQCYVSFCCIAKCISYMYAYPPLFFGFSSHLGHPRALSRVPCAAWLVLLSYLFYTSCAICRDMDGPRDCHLE